MEHDRKMGGMSAYDQVMREVKEQAMNQTQAATGPSRLIRTRADEVKNSFTYHSPTPWQITRYEALRTLGLALAQEILAMVPESREQSVAITKLEECIMWANKGIACND